jgi:hypothetical protein
MLAGEGFTAYNDHATGPGTHANATLYDAENGPTSGLLKDIATGLPTTVTLSTSQTGVTFQTGASNPAAGTDAHNIFSGFVDFTNGLRHSLELEDGDSYTYQFSGLEEFKTYDLAGTAIRGNDPYTDRWTLATLVGADSFTVAHSTGAGVVTSGLSTRTRTTPGGPL